MSSTKVCWLQTKYDQMLYISGEDTCRLHIQNTCCIVAGPQVSVHQGGVGSMGHVLTKILIDRDIRFCRISKCLSSYHPEPW